MLLKIAVAALAVAAACWLVAGVAAADPIYLPWVSLLPATATPLDPTSTNPCRNGSSKCVVRTLREMLNAFTNTASTCNHNAIFQLSYLFVTQDYADTVNADAGFFNDTPFVNNEDAVFAGYYFHAYDNWYGGNQAEVPPAWQVAFRAADQHTVSGSGDLLLGINAHVNRDLPFVLAALGLVNADGTNRKPDHDKVNVILNQVEPAILTAATKRFDPTIFDPSVDPTGLTPTGLFQTLEAWREQAWREAEQLVAATTQQQRDAVANSIEQTALLNAEAIEATYAYQPPLTSTAARDNYCKQHLNDPLPSLTSGS
jgi:hypothetical protein